MLFETPVGGKQEEQGRVSLGDVRAVDCMLWMLTTMQIAMSDAESGSWETMNPKHPSAVHSGQIRSRGTHAVQDTGSMPSFVLHSSYQSASHARQSSRSVSVAWSW